MSVVGEEELTSYGRDRTLPMALRFLAVRTGRLLIVLFGLSVVTFLLVRLLPGGPAETLTGIRANPEAIARINERLGLADPLHQQYLRYVVNLVQLDLGESFFTGVSVSEVILSNLAITVQLVTFSVVLVVVIGIPLAMLAARYQDLWPDQAVRGFAAVTFGFPSFWVGVVLIAFLSLRLGIFPSGGNGEGFQGRIAHLFLPALTLSLTFLAVVIRSMRAAIVEIMDADFVGLAKLKGIRQTKVWIAHIVRIAVIPAVTLIGVNAAYLLGASVVVENVFALNGLGQQLVSAVLQRDFLVVQGITLIFGVLVVAVSMMVEALQAWLDPRRRMSSRG